MNRRSTVQRHRSPTIGLWIGLGILTIISVLTIVVTNRLASDTRAADHGHRILETMTALESSLGRLESSKRAYALTGDERFLTSYEHASTQLDLGTSSLQELTADVPDQRSRFDEIAPALARRRASLHDAIDTRRRLGFDQGREATSVREGAQTSSKVRAVLEAMEAEQRIRIAESNDQIARVVFYHRVVSITGTLASFGFLLLAFMGLRREVRQRLRSEQEVRQKEQSLATMLQSIGDAVIATDMDGTVTRLNPVAEKLTGWSSADAIGKPFSDVVRMVDEATREPAVDPITTVFGEPRGTASTLPLALIQKRETVIPIAHSAAAIRDVGGAATGVVAVLRDVSTERAWAEQLRHANVFLDSIIENIPSVVFVKDAEELRFVRINRAGEAVFASREKLLGKTDHDLLPAEQAATVQAHDREALSSRQLLDIEERIETAQGPRWLHTKKIPIMGSDGTPQYILGIAEDVTHRKEIADRLTTLNEELEGHVRERTADLISANSELQHEITERQRTATALQHSEEQLRQAQKMEAVGRLAGGIAHDFNNILSVILSYSEMLVSDLPDGTSMRADLEEIQKAGTRAADLTRQLLAFSRRQVLAPKLLDLDAVLAGMQKMLARVLGEDVELRIVKGSDLGKIKVDPGQMEQVVMNLVVNARDAMPRGGTLTIETSSRTFERKTDSSRLDLPSGRYVVMTVKDTGTGMDKATQSRIFEPFFTTKEQGKGTGLGLSTVFGIVSQSGGAVSVISEPGQGTMFEVYLPEVVIVGVDAGAGPAGRTAPGGSETILLVEDEAQVRALARSILKSAGYHVLEAGDGVEALEVCTRFSGKIDLVLTDVVMPRMSGRELVEKLSSVRSDVKVLFMSGYTDDTVVRHGVQDDGLVFLQKPITPDLLRRKIREVLDPPGSERA
jgi:two-component system cell cycle sensor histidine kinase/response regulator CckA